MSCSVIMNFFRSHELVNVPWRHGAACFVRQHDRRRRILGYTCSRRHPAFFFQQREHSEWLSDISKDHEPLSPVMKLHARKFSVSHAAASTPVRPIGSATTYPPYTPHTQGDSRTYLDYPSCDADSICRYSCRVDIHNSSIDHAAQRGGTRRWCSKANQCRCPYRRDLKGPEAGERDLERGTRRA